MMLLSTAAVLHYGKKSLGKIDGFRCLTPRFARWNVFSGRLGDQAPLSGGLVPDGNNSELVRTPMSLSHSV